MDAHRTRWRRRAQIAWRVRLPVLAVALVGLAAGCGGGSDAAPELVAVSSRDGDYAIYGMTATGADQHRLTDERGDPSSFSGLQFQTDPAWSPDGQSLAFASARDGSYDIYVMDARGGDTVRLTTSPDEDQQPTWSPDGGKIAFARSAKDGASHIFVMDADGGAVRRLTDDDAPESDPAWSPDGATIAYARRTPGTELGEIWLMNAADGKNRRQLTRVGAAAYNPAWSPDGSLVAFAANPGGARYGIFTIRGDGGGVRRVVAGPDDSFEPAFSPDGQMLAYFTDGAISVVDAAGEDALITDPDDNTSSPAWNPKPPS